MDDVVDDQPEVTGLDDKVWDLDAIRNSRIYNVIDSSNNRNANAWFHDSVGANSRVRHPEVEP